MSFPGMPSVGQQQQAINIIKPRNLPDIVIGLSLILLATFSEYIPIEIYAALDSSIGTVALFLAAALMLYFKGPLFGILTAITVLVIYSQTLNKKLKEGFTEYQYRKYHGKNRWYVEEVLGENPKALEVEKVETLPANN
jgi:hypothetical protein